MTRTMKAIISSPAGPVLGEVARPVPGHTHVLAAVGAASLNRADLAMLTGGSHGPMGGLGQPLGLEWAGRILEVGEGVSGWHVGDRVMTTGGGAFAEYAVSDASRLVKIPDDLSFQQASTLPVALQTMHNALCTAGELQPGQSVLIQGASSGVGLMGMQIAKVLGAGLVIGSSTSTGRRAQLGAFGADLVVDTSDPGWVKQVLDATGGRGVDLVIDQVSGALANANLNATKVGGHIVNVGRLGGMKGEFDFDLHALRQITYIGVTFRTRTRLQVEEIIRDMKHDLAEPLADGRLHLPIDRVYSLAETPPALERMKANQHFGKLVLDITDGYSAQAD